MKRHLILISLLMIILSSVTAQEESTLSGRYFSEIGQITNNWNTSPSNQTYSEWNNISNFSLTEGEGDGFDEGGTINPDGTANNRDVSIGEGLSTILLLLLVYSIWQIKRLISARRRLKETWN